MLNKIINAGLKDDIPPYLKRRVQPSNIIALTLVVVACIPVSTISFIFFPKSIAFIPVLGGIICTGVLVVNFYKGIKYSRLVLALIPIILSSSYNAFLCGPNDDPIEGIFLFELAFGLIPFVIFDLRERWFLLFTVSVTLFLIVGFPWTKNWITVEADISILKEGWISALTYMLAYFTAIACMFGMAYINIKAERTLENFFSLNNDLFVIGNLKGFFTKVNPAWQKLLGYSEQELTSKPFINFVHPEDKEKAYKSAPTLLKGKLISNFLVRYVTKSGEIKSISWNLIPDIIDGVIYASGRDITAQIKAEENIRIKDRAIHAASTGVVITDAIHPDNPVIYCNPSNKLITGYSETETLGKNMRFLYNNDGEQENLQKLRKAIKEERECRVVLRNYKKDGTLFWNELTVSPVFDKIGKVTHFVGLQNDITERVLAQQELKESREQLESKNEELKDFAHIVSHDLKAPLRAINSLSQWIIDDYKDKLDEEGQAQFALLTGRVKKMENLIDGILQYSRASKNTEEKMEVNLNELLEEVIDMISPPQNINVHVVGDLPKVVVARTRIQQVFQNLISNAVKYNDKEIGEVKVASKRENDHWEFSIRDNGPGIEKQNFEKIFQIFQTLDSKESYENTGIGLTIVKKTIELHSGKIWVDSEVGVGTTFYFTLPLELSNGNGVAQKPKNVNNEYE